MVNTMQNGVTVTSSMASTGFTFIICRCLHLGFSSPIFTQPLFLAPFFNSKTTNIHSLFNVRTANYLIIINSQMFLKFDFTLYEPRVFVFVISFLHTILYKYVCVYWIITFSRFSDCLCCLISDCNSIVLAANFLILFSICATLFLSYLD